MAALTEHGAAPNTAPDGLAEHGAAPNEFLCSQLNAAALTLTRRLQARTEAGPALPGALTSMKKVSFRHVRVGST